MDELLVVLEDARLAGDAVAIERLGVELAEQLGVAEAGADRFGLWLRLEVAGASHRMRWCWPGRFFMGSPEDDEEAYDREGRQHPVVLTRGFWLGETPVTQALWAAVMDGDNPSRFEGPDRPVEQVSWKDCQRFCERLALQHPALQPRLPTEAQWEYAARAGTTTPRYGELDDIAWYRVNSNNQTPPVAQKQPNAWGLYDMLGSVWEWCQDASELETYEPEEQRDPLRTKGSRRVVCGGSWFDRARHVRAACRLARSPGCRLDYLGFRLAGGALRGGAKEGGARQAPGGTGGPEASGAGRTEGPEEEGSE